MRAAAGAISRAPDEGAHPEIAGEDLELGEIQLGQRFAFIHLTHAWPRASSAAGEARRDARGCGRDQPRAGEGARAP